jgi:N-methylhydantoinase B
MRTSEERQGDLDAQLAANHVGAQALARMVANASPEEVRFYGNALLNYSAAFMERVIATIPDGVYEFEDALDDDGAGTQDIPIRVKVTIEGDRATVDLTECSDHVAGCVNCPSAVTQSAVYYCFMCLMADAVPLNAGCFRNIRVLTRPGSLLHAEYPAGVVAGNTETSQRVVDVVFGALAKALPDRIPAASCGTMSSVALGGDAWTYYETIGGGCGAGPGWHGASAIQCHMTNTWNTPAEALELQYPLRVLRFERAGRTGGRGTYAGGDGIVREVQALAPCEGTLLTDRRRGRPYGLDRGEAGREGRNAVARCGGTDETLPGKCHVRLNPGDILHVRTPGGGGVRPPVADEGPDVEFA